MRGPVQRGSAAAPLVEVVIACSAERGIMADRSNEDRDSVELERVQVQAQATAPQVTQSELEFQEQMIAEREGEIREIESGIHELNDIFRDLGAIIQEQGGLIGESSVEGQGGRLRGEAGRGCGGGCWPAVRSVVPLHERRGRRCRCRWLEVVQNTRAIPPAASPTRSRRRTRGHTVAPYLPPSSPASSPYISWHLQVQLTPDNIESNIVNVHAHTSSAAEELTSAHEYQRKAGRRMACLLIILAIVALFILLAILA